MAKTAYPMLRFTASYPPSTNNLYFTAGRRRVKTPEARAYADHVKAQVEYATWRGDDPGEPPYLLQLDLYPPSRRPDATNSVKCLEDALFKAIGRNDRTVRRVIIEKHDPEPLYPHVDVMLTTVDAHEALRPSAAAPSADDDAVARRDREG